MQKFENISHQLYVTQIMLIRLQITLALVLITCLLHISPHNDFPTICCLSKCCDLLNILLLRPCQQILGHCSWFLSDCNCDLWLSLQLQHLISHIIICAVYIIDFKQLDLIYCILRLIYNIQVHSLSGIRLIFYLNCSCRYVTCRYGSYSTIFTQITTNWSWNRLECVFFW